MRIIVRAGLSLIVSSLIPCLSCPAEDEKPAVLSITPADTNQICQATNIVQITGRVRASRDDNTWKIKELDFISDDGKTYIVKMDEQGKLLSKVLKNRIVKATSRLNESGDKSAIVVEKFEITGIVSNTPAETIKSDVKAGDLKTEVVRKDGTP